MVSPRVLIVLPAYNAQSTLAATLGEIPPGLKADLLLVDDASTDGTVALAQKMGIPVFCHTHNQGYGANQKTCYRLALEKGADYVVMLHPDHQYDGRVIPDLLHALNHGQADIALGSRFLGGLIPPSMPLWRAMGNIALTQTQNWLLHSTLSEFHTGLRAYSAPILKKLPLEDFSNHFLFDQELLTAAIRLDAKITEIPIETRYFKGASSISFPRAVQYGLRTLSLTWRNRS